MSAPTFTVGDRVQDRPDGPVLLVEQVIPFGASDWFCRVSRTDELGAEMIHESRLVRVEGGQS